jgi:hypothetical protein
VRPLGQPGEPDEDRLGFKDHPEEASRQYQPDRTSSTHRSSVDLANMSCAGHCFDLVPLAAPSSHQKKSLGKSPKSSSLPPHTYSPLQPWQARILCLHPSKTCDRDEQNNSELRGDLLIANLLALEGVTVEGNSKIISYKALSYSWGHPELFEVLFCNGKARPISRSNAAALRALRHTTNPTYLWIDAICNAIAA